jgi:quercetin dioxygenase-like cupin family protein
VVEGDGLVRRIMVEPGDFGTTTFMVAEVVLAPGASDPWHRHPGSEHVMVVFEGRGIVTVGEVTETLEPLTGIRIEPGLAHRIENTGRTRLRYYVCGSPAADPVLDREPAEAPPHRLDA